MSLRSKLKLDPRLTLVAEAKNGSANEGALFIAPAFAARYTGDPPDDALYWAFINAIVVGIMALIIHYVRKLCSKINTFVVQPQTEKGGLWRPQRVRF